MARRPSKYKVKWVGAMHIAQEYRDRKVVVCLVSLAADRQTLQGTYVLM